MKRRDFGKVFTAGAIGTSVSHLNSAEAITNPAQMHVGTQRFGTSTIALQFKKRHGVDHHDAGTPTYTYGEGWDLNQLIGWKEKSEELWKAIQI